MAHYTYSSHNTLNDMAQEEKSTTLELVTLTAEQQQYLNDMAAYGKRLQELAYNSVGKWVAAGYAGGRNNVAGMYCYCGIGKGYKGAPIVPANGNAVVFASREAAQRKASLLKYQNGRGERIRLMALPANEYFWLLHDDLCNTMHVVERMMRDNNKR